LNGASQLNSISLSLLSSHSSSSPSHSLSYLHQPQILLYLLSNSPLASSVTSRIQTSAAALVSFEHRALCLPLASPVSSLRLSFDCRQE
ncbi:unnamed protein product, partial [Brassica oleracea var. botrytis]